MQKDMDQLFKEINYSLHLAPYQLDTIQKTFDLALRKISQKTTLSDLFLKVYKSFLESLTLLELSKFKLTAPYARLKNVSEGFIEIIENPEEPIMDTLISRHGLQVLKGSIDTSLTISLVSALPFYIKLPVKVALSLAVYANVEKISSPAIESLSRICQATLTYFRKKGVIKDETTLRTFIQVITRFSRQLPGPDSAALYPSFPFSFTTSPFAFINPSTNQMNDSHHRKGREQQYNFTPTENSSNSKMCHSLVSSIELSNGQTIDFDTTKNFLCPSTPSCYESTNNNTFVGSSSLESGGSVSLESSQWSSYGAYDAWR